MKDEQPWKPELPKLDVPKSSDHHEYGKTFDTNESQQQVPPGIVAFKKKSGFISRIDTWRYEQWASDYLYDPDNAIHTISVDGKEWSVNGWIEDKEFGDVIISRLEYDFDEKRWIGYSGESWYDLNHLSKLPPPSQQDRSVSQPGKEEGAWSKEQLSNMLEDVVNVLDLSESMIEKHGPLGTAPAELVREVLKQKDLTIRLLKAGFKHIDPQPSQPVQGKYKQGHTFEAIQKMREISQADPKVHNEIAEHAQPPLTEQGKEEDRLTEVEWAKKSGFLAIAVRVQELEIENSRLKSKPTDGWSEPSDEESKDAFNAFMYEQPVGYPAEIEVWRAAIQWLSSYKAKQKQ